MTVSMINAGLPAAVSNLIQAGVLDRVFRENLFPRLLFRSEFFPELWETNLGESKIWTRPGLMPRVVTPLTPGQDPTASSYNFEQWTATASQYGDTIPTHMPTSTVALAPLFLRNIQELGKGAGLSINSLARDKLFMAYLAGDTLTIAAALLGATTIRVSSLNGFTEKLLNSRPSPVSGLNPLAITFTVAEPANTVVGVLPDDPTRPFGPGTLQLGTALATALVVARTGVKAANRSRIVRAGGALTTDGITATNLLGLQNIIDAVAVMRANNVGPTSDGYYHVHVTPEGEAQLYADAQFRQLFQSLPDSMEYRELAIGQLVGCRFYRNTECPNLLNVTGASLVATGASSIMSSEIGGELVNATGVALKYAAIVGGGVGYEPYIDESRYISEAGVNGKIGEFSITNGGVQVMTDRIRLILRAPQDKLQQVVDSSWSWSGDFAIPSDELTGSASRFKRCTIIVHA